MLGQQSMWFSFLRLDHHNANPELVGKKLPVCRAIATTKMQYLPGIQSWLRQEAGVTDPLEGNRFHLAQKCCPQGQDPQSLTRRSQRCEEAWRLPTAAAAQYQ